MPNNVGLSSTVIPFTSFPSTKIEENPKNSNDNNVINDFLDDLLGLNDPQQGNKVPKSTQKVEYTTSKEKQLVTEHFQSVMDITERFESIIRSFRDLSWIEDIF